ncbi:hypothetical protein FACS189464_4080 [Bacteroidia bacterium]|nr:hypothetical protein FACS189464_4080 [Bacteroidia bacterium]
MHFDMEPRVVKANDKVEADRGKIAIERGPIVYCAEWADNDFDIFNVVINQKPEIRVETKPDLLKGIHQLKTTAQLVAQNETGRLQVKDVTLSLTPYYAWNHRGSGKMSVWLLQNLTGLSR